MFAAQGMGSAPMSGLKDELTIAAGKVTPGVDDGPYIQFAIEALTRQRDDVSDGLSDGDFEDEMEGVPPPSTRRTTQDDEEMGYPPLAVPQSIYAGHRDRDTSRPQTRRHSQKSQRSQPSRHSSSASQHSRGSSRPLAEDHQFDSLSSVSQTIETPALPGLIRPESREPQLQQQQQTTQRPSTRPEREIWIPVTREMRDNFYPNDKAYPPLTFKPRLLRPFSLIIFIAFCLAMVAALVSAAIYADRNRGLTPYSGTIYSGQYFLFRILPQLLAACILVYAQAVVAASLRILPFANLASEDARVRYLALFQRMYPTTYLWPRLVGPWPVKAFNVAAWLALFTVPLQSGAFTCILVDDEWRWSTSSAVIWILVALYLLIAAASAAFMVFWFGKWTGLMWDVRSIGDLIPLLSRSNTTSTGYSKGAGPESATLKDQLRDRWFDRLGYWRTEDMQTGGIWYGIGTSGTPAEQDTHVVHELMGKRRPSFNPSIQSHDLAVLSGTGTSPASRYRYLPWCLQDAPLIAFAVSAGCLLITLLIVSFLPQTRLEAGFLPLLSAKPGNSAFSAANFLYSFLPSLLGMFLFLLFQTLDQTLRIIQPWGELSRSEGSVARKSLLADYAACSSPIEAAWRAARVGHWRLAIVSVTAALSLFIPILAGGLFMALTTRAGQVRMFPSIPVYGVLLALLFLYAAGLTLLLLPRQRRHFRLPHAVDNLAGVISLCTADELTRDAAFRSVRSRGDLASRLGADKATDPREESVWCFGVVPGKDERRLSVRRMRRFTEKSSRPMRRSYTRSMV